MRRHRLLWAIALLLVVATAPVIFAVDAWRYKRLLREAERAFVANRFAEASTRLADMSKRWPNQGMVEYWLGAALDREGDRQRALDAWGRVPPKSPQGALAQLSIGRVGLETGRYALAEANLAPVIQFGGDLGEEARRLMSLIHFMTGRRDAYRAFLFREMDRMNDPSEKLRTLWSVDRDPYPVDAFTATLTKAHAAFPDDDRVWLGLADLLTRQGRYAEADDFLKRCEATRPDDAAVWTARIDWGVAADRPDEVLKASEHLLASNLRPARILELKAWLAAKSGNQDSEKAALESLIAIEPAHAVAIERLADLAAQGGDKERLAALRGRKVTIENARDRYRTLINQAELVPLAADLARSAEQIGRRFDAKTWWRIAAARDKSLESESLAARERLAKLEPHSTGDAGKLAVILEPLYRPSNARIAAGLGVSVPKFADVAERQGLRFTFSNGITDLRQLPETMSGGVAVLDFDGDGWLDVYAIQGGKFPPPSGTCTFSDVLFRNNGDGHFSDVTRETGLANFGGGYGHGAAVGDYDNDGRPDLFVTRWRSYALYRNVGGRFEDATRQAGLDGDRDWPTSAAWADLDNDGDLDLYVCQYLKWDTENPTKCGYPGNPAAGNTYCDPRGFTALSDHIFRNDGGRFVDVTPQSGLVDKDGRGLGVVAADLDGDRKIDLFVANDTTANFFLRNQGGFRFSEEGLESGLAASAGGGYLAGMGVACGDFDGDQKLDLGVTNFYNQSTTLYHNHGAGVFSDRSAETGLAVLTKLVLGFGLAAVDANNDGRLDLVQANGHVGDYRPSIPYQMRPQLFLADGQGKFVDAGANAGDPWQAMRIGRGLAIGDFDNDGNVDVIIVSENEPLALLKNEGIGENHSLTLALEGSPSNRDAVGAQVVVSAGGQSLLSVRFGGGSYLSASDPRLHFGVGKARKIDRVEVTWPSGRRDSYAGLSADAGYRLREGNPTPKPLPGFSRSVERP
jgi:tetratricopeptide (TPR) repeat protein